jgi:hypothetical protein
MCPVDGRIQSRRRGVRRYMATPELISLIVAVIVWILLLRSLAPER